MSNSTSEPYPSAIVVHAHKKQKQKGRCACSLVLDVLNALSEILSVEAESGVRRLQMARHRIHHRLRVGHIFEQELSIRRRVAAEHYNVPKVIHAAFAAARRHTAAARL